MFLFYYQFDCFICLPILPLSHFQIPSLGSTTAPSPTSTVSSTPRPPWTSWGCNKWCRPEALGAWPTSAVGRAALSTNSSPTAEPQSGGLPGRRSSAAQLHSTTWLSKPKLMISSWGCGCFILKQGRDCFYFRETGDLWNFISVAMVVWGCFSWKGYCFGLFFGNCFDRSLIFDNNCWYYCGYIGRNFFNEFEKY